MKDGILESLYIKSFPIKRHIFSKNYFEDTNKSTTYFEKNYLSFRCKIHGGPCKIEQTSDKIKMFQTIEYGIIDTIRRKLC